MLARRVAVACESESLLGYTAKVDTMSARELELLLSRVLEYDVPMQAEDMEWLFAHERCLPFLSWLCDNLSTANVVPTPLLHAYVARARRRRARHRCRCCRCCC